MMITPAGGAIACVALDYRGTTSTATIDEKLGQKPVDPAAAAALRILVDDLGVALVLASNGNNLDRDVAAPLTHGMRAALNRPNSLTPDEALPEEALIIGHVRELPDLLEKLL
ncbi:MAG: hypothetical protein ACRDPT_03665 [Streptomycetales bacterium]